jgi:protein involved in polysaccharide export with SLBB domain
MRQKGYVLKKIWYVVLIAFFAKGIVYAQLTDPSELERLAKAQGYSDAQISIAKQKYGNNENPPSQSRVVKVDENVQRFGDDENSVPANPDFDTTKEKKDIVKVSDSSSLPFFGYNVFKNIPDAFSPNAIGPVDPGYIVGPGDVLRLTVWGQAEFQYELTVSKEGKVFIPVAGQVYVTGVPFDELQKKIKGLLSRNYSGLSSDPQRTFMDLTVAKIRPIRIFIMGEVDQPGGYTVSSYATVFNALYSVGGPLEKGSLRTIKVIRNAKEVATVDLYGYLLSGKCTTDVRLQNNDVVFVPPRRKTIAVTGSVFRPSYYELADNENLASLLNYCGGVLSLTNIDRAQLFRVLPFDKRDNMQELTLMNDINLKECILQKKELPLYDKDSLSFTVLYNDLKNKVKLSGAVQYPGLYQSDSLTIAELIFDYGKVIEDKYYSLRADLYRLNEDLTSKRLIPVDLEKLRKDPTYNFKMAAGDEVVVKEKTVEKPADMVISILGEVNKPGVCTLSTNMTLIDAIFYAGGFNYKAYKKSVDLYRLNKTSLDSLCTVYKVELPDSFSYMDETMRNFPLEDRDRIVVRIDPTYSDIQTVYISGKVKYQGGYALVNRDVKLVEIIDRAGGLLPEAFLDGASVTRNGKRFVVNFEKAYFQKKEKENIVLQPGDSIYIPGKPNTVTVSGNVNNPGLFSFVEGDRIGAYLNRAGGLADSTNYILLTNPNGGSKKIHSTMNRTKVLDGSIIHVAKKPYVDETGKKQGPTVAEVIRDTLAIVTSAVTVIALVIQLKKK